MEQLLGSRYVLHEPVGRGGMGQVFRGSVRETGDPVAVKMLMPELVSDPDIVARFFRERSILLSITHRNVVRVIDLVVEGQTLAIVMELVEGKDLRRELHARRTLPPAQAAAYCRELLDGLIAVHSAGIVHRDVKPENLLIDTSGAQPCLKLTDFGVARLTYGGSLTKVSSVIGTPEYMAPEIVDHERATPAVDLYSTGVVLYEMLAGRTPFAGGHPIAVLHRHLSDEPLPIPNAPPQMWSLVESLLAKDPDSRPQSAAQVADVLAAIEPSLAGLPALPVMPAPVFQPAAPRRATPHPDTQVVSHPAAVAAPGAMDPALATETVLRQPDPGRAPEPGSMPSGPQPRRARPIRGRLAAFVLSAAVLAAAAAAAVLITRHPSAAPRPDALATSGIRSLAITPATIQMTQNHTSQLTLTGQLSDGSGVSPQALASAVWASADPTVATVGDNGTVTAVGAGSTYITARIGSAVASARLFVASAPAPTPSTIPAATVTVSGPPVVVTVSPTPSTGPPAVFAYKVFHSCRAGSTCGLAVRSGPGLNYQITGSLQNNQPVEIICQTAGQLSTNSQGVSSYVWDELLQGGYVSDLYIDTQGARISPTMSGFSAGVPRC